MPHARYSVDPFLHVLWTAGCCTAPLHNALVSWLSNTRSARTFYFLPKEAASVRWALLPESTGTQRFVPLAPTSQMCSLLVIMVFRTIVAFDPWSGYALNGFPLYRKQQPCMECTESTLRPSNSVLANWLDLCSWIIPLISALRRALGLDDSTQAPAQVDVLPTVQAMLLVADALFRLHAFADASGFEAALRQSLVMSYGAPPLVLFCCFGLITSAYLKGEGQEETRQTRLCARLFRFYRALYSQTPFHIGLPSPCPPQLSVTSGSSSPAVGYRAYSMAHTSQSVAPPLPHLVHDICPARLAMYALRLTSEVAPNLPAGRSKEFDAETIPLPAVPLWQRAETLLWNITAQLAPDLFLWFEAFLVRPLLAQLSTSTLRPTKRRCKKNVCCFPNDKNSALLSYLPVESNTFNDGSDPEKREEEDWVSAAVLTLGNNAIAGALGVGTPRYMKHDPSLYDIAPEFQNENARLIAQGVDVWCAGNPVLPVLVNQDDPIIGVAAGEHHTLLLTSKRVLAWGCNSYQQCGPVFQKPTMRWSTGALAECFRPGVSCDAAVEALTRYVAAWLEGSAVEVNGSLNLDVSEYSAREESKGSRAVLSSTHRSTADYYNANHRLDTAVLTPQEVFFKNNIDSPIIQVLAGATFSLARTQQGRLWLWGNLQDGCLGRYHNARPGALDGDETGRFVLASLKATRSTSNGFQRKLRAYLHARLHCIRFCACGMLHVAAVDSYGGLWVWGQSEAGQLGFVPPFPLLPSGYSSELSKLHPGAVFYPHRLRLFLYKLTGGNDTLPTDAFFETSLTRFTTLISFLWSKARQQLHQLLASLQLEVPQSDLAQHISCRLSVKYSVLLVAVTDHVLLNWSRLDLDSIFGSRPLCPTELQFDLVSCGEGHTLAAGHFPASPSPWLLAWGQGKYGQLGLGDSTRNAQPVVDIEALLVNPNSEPAFITESDAKVVPCIVSWRKSLHSTSSPSIKLLRSGGCANALVSNDGQLLLWGSNDFGVLGFKERTTQEVRSPRLYSEFPDDFGAVKDVVFAMGGTRTFVVSATGRVLCFGQDQDGASGSRIGKTGAVRVLSDHRRWHPPHTTPVLFPPKLRVSALAAGAAHTVFIPLNSSPSNMNHLRLSYLNQSVQNHAASAVVELPSAGRTAITNAQVKIGSSPIRPEYVTCSDLSPGTDALQLQAFEKQSTVDSSVSTPLARRSTYHSHSANPRSHQKTSPFAQRLSSFGQTLLNGVSVTVKALGQALQDQQEPENNANFNYRKPQRSRSYVHKRNTSYSRHASMPLPLMQRRRKSPARPQPPLPFAQRDTPEPSISRSISWQHSSVVPYPYSPAATAFRSPQTASHRPAPFTLSSRYTTPRDTNVRRALPAPPTPDRRATLSSTRYRQSAPLSSQYLLWVSDPPALSRYPLPTPVSPIRPLLPCSSSAPWPPSSCHLRHP